MRARGPKVGTYTTYYLAPNLERTLGKRSRVSLLSNCPLFLCLTPGVHSNCIAFGKVGTRTTYYLAPSLE